MALVSVNSNNQSLNDKFYNLVKQQGTYSLADIPNTTKIILEKRIEKPVVIEKPVKGQKKTK